MAWLMNLSSWKAEELEAAHGTGSLQKEWRETERRQKDRRDEFFRGNHLVDSGEGPASGMAIQRCHQFHVVLRAARGCHLQFFVRPHGGRISTHCWWIGLGGISFCRCSRLESDMGERDAQRGSGRIPG